MKKRIKCTTFSFCFLVLFGNANLASSATTPEIEAIFNWAESNFSNFFPNHQTTQMIDPWAFRFYPSTGIYVGAKNNEVFVLGGSFGSDNPTFIDTVPSLFAQVQGSGGNGSVPGCDTSDIPAGLVVTQNGNVVNITTNGQCIVVPNPANNNFCGVPPQPQATGISVLSSTNVTSLVIKGIEISTPGIPNPFESAAENITDSKFCEINAPAELANQIVNSDICFDMTDQFGPLSDSSIPGITITPPITTTFVGTATNQVVPDCFATDATVVNDAFTGETWTRDVNGNLVQTGF
ncbi:MAG: hypothetical protein K0U40_03630 [Betaproteobacteria bacterium]|nr:hypothetical protein [Betaproteobacteria bacterium]